MTTIISSMAFKGGATKSFTTVQTAAASARAGLLTVVIDGDMQANAGKAIGVDSTEGFFKLLAGGSTWKRELVQAPFEFTNLQNAPLLVLPGGAQTGSFKSNPITVSVMAEQIALLRGWADVVLIDTAPGYDEIHAAVYAVSDFIILPTVMELDSIESLSQSIQMMQETVKGGGRVPDVLGIFPNRFNSKYNSNRSMYSQLQTTYRRSYKVFDPMMESVACLDARDRCMSLYAHAETVGNIGFGRRYDKRAANRAVKNFDDSLAQKVLSAVEARSAVA